jgi:hypothetical protein
LNLSIGRSLVANMPQKIYVTYNQVCLFHHPLIG